MWELNFKRSCDVVLIILCGFFCFLAVQTPLSSQPDFLPAPAARTSPQVLENFAVHLKLAQAFSEKEPLWSEAEKEFNLAKALQPRDFQPYLGLARLDVKRDDYGQAAKDYRRTVELNVDLVDTHTSAYLGKELIAFTKEALRRFKTAERETPDDQLNRKALQDAYFLKRKLAGGCD